MYADSKAENEAIHVQKGIHCRCREYARISIFQALALPRFKAETEDGRGGYGGRSVVVWERSGLIPGFEILDRIPGPGSGKVSPG